MGFVPKLQWEKQILISMKSLLGRLLQLQKQQRVLVLDSRSPLDLKLQQSCRDRQETKDLSLQLAALVSRAKTNHVSYTNNPLYVDSNQEQCPHFPYNSFKMDYGLMAPFG